MSPSKELTIPDIYWGEFSEERLDKVLQYMRDGKYKTARTYIREDLRRDDFIFGQARSDFLYYLQLDERSTCLDVGCGLGVHSFNAARYAGHVEAFDQSLKRVEFCRLRAEAEGVSNISFHHADVKHLPFKPSSFDAIIMNGVVEWLGEGGECKDPREDQLRVLRTMRNLLKTNGQLYIGIENRFALAYFKNGIDHSGVRYTSLMPRWVASLYTQLRLGKAYRTYTYTHKGYYKLLQEAGFEQSKITCYIAHPGYNLPQYIIPYDDLGALRFFLVGLTANKGWRGYVIRRMAGFDLFLRLVRNLFFSYALYAKV